MSRRRHFAVLAFATVVLAAGCGGGGGGTDDDAGPALPPEAQRGRMLVEERGCLSCHALDNRRSAGPTWKGLAGSEVQLADGRRVRADADYLRRSILEPDADVVAGFPAGLMGSVIRPGTVSAEEADAIVRYLEALR